MTIILKTAGIALLVVSLFLLAVIVLSARGFEKYEKPIYDAALKEKK